MRDQLGWWHKHLSKKAGRGFRGYPIGTIACYGPDDRAATKLVASNWLWRSVKYGGVYPHAFETGSEARAGLGRWITYDNADRPHSALGGRTPAEAHGHLGRHRIGGVTET